MRDALQWPVDARLVHKVYRSSAPGLPVSSYDDLSACDILPPPKRRGFSLKHSNEYSINELTQCVPRFYMIGYAVTNRIPSFLMFIAAFIPLS